MKKYDQNVKEELYNVYLIMGMLLNQTISASYSSNYKDISMLSQ